MKKRAMSLVLALGVMLTLACGSVYASTFTDAHGNVIELDDTLEAYSSVKLDGADDAARKGETNLGDLWTDALRWFAVSGKINGYFDEDDVKAGNGSIVVDADHVVALWNGGNLRADIAEGKFGAETLANVLPYPNRVAVVYMTGAQLQETLEAASQGLPYSEASAAACASFMQVSGLSYTVDAGKAFDKGEVYKEPWYKAASVQRVTIGDVNGKAFDAAATYAVVTSNANFNGMDSSYIFKAAAEADSRSAITTAVVRDVVWMYIDEALENVVGDTYAAAAGRITVANVPETPAQPEPTPGQPSQPQQPEQKPDENGLQGSGTVQQPENNGSQTPAEGQDKPAQGSSYTVKKGDSMWKIASSVYGSGAEWSRIARANPQVKDPARIYVGQVLVIPTK